MRNKVDYNQKLAFENKINVWALDVIDINANNKIDTMKILNSKNRTIVKVLNKKHIAAGNRVDLRNWNTLDQKNRSKRLDFENGDAIKLGNRANLYKKLNSKNHIIIKALNRMNNKSENISMIKSLYLPVYNNFRNFIFCNIANILVNFLNNFSPISIIFFSSISIYYLLDLVFFNDLKIYNFANTITFYY